MRFLRNSVEREAVLTPAPGAPPFTPMYGSYKSPWAGPLDYGSHTSLTNVFYLGFVPNVVSGTVNGYCVNGVDNSFVNCDTNPSR